MVNNTGNNRWSKATRTLAAAFLGCFLVSSTGSFFPVAHAFTTTPVTTPIRFPPRLRHGLGFSSYGRSRIEFPPPQVRKSPRAMTPLFESSSSAENDDSSSEDKIFDAKTTFALIGGQSVLVVLAAIAAKVVGTPNLGLGPGFDASPINLARGIVWSLPLGVLAVVLDLFETRFPALQEVTKATQSSVLSLLGGTFKLWWGMLTALCLGAAAGLGEEMLFRGVLQFELARGILGGNQFLAVGISSLIFGALHAVTPLYAGLAALASVYFGWLYLATGNLVVPIVAHAFYDFCALLYAHWEVSNMEPREQEAILRWRPNAASAGNGEESPP